MNIRHRRIDTYPKISQGCVLKALGKMMYAGSKTRGLGLRKEETVCSGSYILYACAPCMLYQGYEICKVEQRFAARKGDHLYSLFRRGIQHSLDVVHLQTMPREVIGYAHSALGTAGIAVIGKLNNQLSRGASGPKE